MTTILVTGATGNVGSPLVALLAAAGADVRAVTRGPGPATVPAHVDVITADPSRPDTLAAALHGVTGIFVNPRAVGRDTASDLLSLAAEHGVRRVVGLAAINVEDDVAVQPSRFLGSFNREVEEAVVACGLEWVSLRPTVYAANTALTWSGQVRAGDVVHGPYASSSSAPIHEDDVAGVAAHAFLHDDLLGKRPQLTGPRSLTNTELVATIGEVIGRPLRYEEVTPAAARKTIIDRGGSAAAADALLAYQAQTVAKPAAVTDTVAGILGRAPRSYAEWVADHATTFQPAAASADHS